MGLCDEVNWVTAGTWSFSSTFKIVKVVLPNGSAPLPRHRGADQEERNRRTDRQRRCSLEDLRQRSRASRDAHVWVTNAVTCTGSRGTVGTGPAAEIRLDPPDTTYATPPLARSMAGWSPRDRRRNVAVRPPQGSLSRTEAWWHHAILRPMEGTPPRATTRTSPRTETHTTGRT